jgi:hypothetical protein
MGILPIAPMVTFRMLDIVSEDLTRWREDSFIRRYTLLINCRYLHFRNSDIRYGEIDHVYGWKAYENHNGFTNAQSLLNVVEISMQVYYLTIRKKPGYQALALMMGYTATLMTTAKTALYFLMELYSGFVPIGGEC